MSTPNWEGNTPIVQDEDDPPMAAPQATKMRSIHRGQEVRAADPNLLTFPDSGITVRLLSCGPDTVAMIQRSVMKHHPQPKPPMVDTPLGPEENRASETYRKEFGQWLQFVNTEIGQKLTKLALKRIQVTMDETAVQAVKDFREQMAELEIDEEELAKLTDRDIYIRHICLSSANDISHLMMHFTRQSMPTEEAVAEATAAFQGEGGEPGHLFD